MSKEKLVEVKIGNETILIPEGLWSKLKNFVARAGSLEKGGKIFGRSEKEKAAKDQIENVLNKKNREMIKNLDAALKKIKQKGEKLSWPNNEDEFMFRDGAAEIAVVYNSIVNSKEMDAVAKNAAIDDLRIYVKKLIDYDLADVYKSFNENQKKEMLDEIFGLSNDEKLAKAMAKLDQEDAGGPISAKGDETAVGKGLESNLLPGLLAAGGAGALLASSPWFQELLTTTDVTQEPDKIVKIVNDTVVGDATKGDGLTQMLGRLAKGDPAAFKGNTKAVDFFKDIKQLGITPDNPGGLADMADNSGDFNKSWEAIKGVMEANPDATLTDLFVADGKVNPAFFIKKAAPLIKRTVTSVIKKGATTAVKGGVGASLGKLAAATGLAKMGIPLVAGGALIKSLRQKGKDQSRFQVLNQVLKDLKPVPAETPAEKKVDQAVNDPKPEVEAPSEDKELLDLLKDLPQAAADAAVSPKGEDTDTEFSERMKRIIDLFSKAYPSLENLKDRRQRFSQNENVGTSTQAAFGGSKAGLKTGNLPGSALAQGKRNYLSKPEPKPEEKPEKTEPQMMLRKDLSSDELELLRQALEAFKGVSKVSRASQGRKYFKDIMAAFKKAEKEPESKSYNRDQDMASGFGLEESKQCNRFKKLAGIIKG